MTRSAYFTEAEFVECTLSVNSNKLQYNTEITPVHFFFDPVVRS